MKYYFFLFLCLFLSPAWSFEKALIRGAAVYRAYCAGCHTLHYASPAIETSLPRQDALKWFGKVPPDLSFVMTYRGGAWIHDYLVGFYPDSAQSYGENNHLLPHLKMPNPFSMLSLTEKEELIEDLCAFLAFVADPSKETRREIGVWILSWLFCLNIVLYCLYRLIQKKINTKK